MKPNEKVTDAELSERLRKAAGLLEEGRWTLEEASALLELASAFFERAAVLRHEAAKPLSVPDPVVSAPEQQSATKQINLLDVIEELEAEVEVTPLPEPEPMSDPVKDEPLFEALDEVVITQELTAAPAASASETEMVPEPEVVMNREVTQPVLGPLPSGHIAEQPLSVVTSINDKLSSGMPKRSLADKLALTPLADIKKAISLNLKFQFINELFGGNAAEFEAAIQKLNSASDAKSALSILEHEMLLTRGWDVESKVFLDLHTLVERRFL